MRRYRFAVLIPLLLVPRAASPQGEPLGPEFRVNTYDVQSEGQASVALAGSDFVVVWQGNDSLGLGVFGRRYDSAGEPLGTEFRVNTYTFATQSLPAVGANASGDFVVVWESKQTFYGSFPWDVFGQRYDASGAPVGPEFKVNATGANYQRYPAVAVAPSGAFLVVWSKAYGTGPPGPFDVWARRYDSSGVPQGPDFQVNTYTPNSQTLASVAADPAGNFVVVWSSQFQSGDLSLDVFGQRYAPSGAPLGPEFRVNTYAPGNQSGFPRVATDPSGNFVVAWGSEFSGTPPEPGLFAQRFAPTGSPLGSEFRVNTSTTVGNHNPAIAFDGNGNFVIAWVISGSFNGDVFGQRYSSLGVPSGPEFRVNTTTTGLQRWPSVASTPGGTFLVTWNTGPIGQVSDDVFGQRFGGVFPVTLQDFQVE